MGGRGCVGGGKPAGKELWENDGALRHSPCAHPEPINTKTRRCSSTYRDDPCRTVSTSRNVLLLSTSETGQTLLLFARVNSIYVSLHSHPGEGFSM